MAPNTLPAMAKSAANYANSALIKMEAIADGYAEGIALDVYGNVSEGSGQNIFIVRDGTILHAAARVVDPRRHHARLGHDARPRSRLSRSTEPILPREALYIADEVFFVGTAAEVTPIRSVDKIKIGAGRRGPITEALQQRVLRRHQRRGAGHARLADLRLSGGEPGSAQRASCREPAVWAESELMTNARQRSAEDRGRQRRVRPAPEGRQLPDDARPRRR